MSGKDRQISGSDVFSAVQEINIDTLRERLSSADGASRLKLLASRPHGDRTYFHLVAMSDSSDLVPLLCDSVPEGDCTKLLLLRDEESHTPIHLAVQYKRAWIVKDFFKKLSIGERVKCLRAKSDNGATALHQAMTADVDTVESLLKDIPVKQCHQLLMCSDNTNATPLHLAIDRRNVAIIQHILTVYYKSPEMAHEKLETLQAVDSTGFNVFQKSCLQDDAICLQPLLQALTASERLQMIRPWCDDGQTVLCHVVQRNNPMILKHLLKAICDRERVDLLLSKSFHRCTPLHLAAIEKRLDILIAILETVEDPGSRVDLLTVRNREGLTALQIIFNYQDETLTRETLTRLGDILSRVALHSLLMDIEDLNNYPFVLRFGIGQALQLFNVTNKQLTLNEETLKTVFEPLQDKAVFLIAASGFFRQGRSFLLNLFIRYLRHAESTTNWLEDDSARIDGFGSQSSSERTSSGVDIWSVPYFVTINSGEKVAVLLLETRGLDAPNISQQLSARIFDVSTRICDVQLYNVSSLQQLQCLSDILKPASDSQIVDEIWRSPLTVVVRDSSHLQGKLGFIGGEWYWREVATEYLLELMNPQNSELPKELTDLKCFLLPHPGEAMVRKKKGILLSDVDKNFLQYCDELIRQSVNSTISPIRKGSILQELIRVSATKQPEAGVCEVTEDVHPREKLEEPLTVHSEFPSDANITAVNQQQQPIANSFRKSEQNDKDVHLEEPANLPVGLRVVRGPDWKWDEQDGGEGHLGTLVKVVISGDVLVQWDNGTKANYRTGYDNAYDLRLFDNAQSGVRHPYIQCDACMEDDIYGIRWKCGVCDNYDLCSPCYNSGKHDLSHPFVRIIAPNYKGVEVSKREGLPTTMARGVFVGAIVQRGPSWSWGNQDGGEGNTGRVLGVEGRGESQRKNGMKVLWQGGHSNTYRLGYKGEVDLIFKTAANGGVYYPEHLPQLGDPSALVEVTSAGFKVGDKVRMDMDPEQHEIMQAGHGGWVPTMAEYRDKVGTVQTVRQSGDIIVKYPRQQKGFLCHASAFTKVPAAYFKVGDRVKILDNVDSVKILQDGHGGWVKPMKRTLGKVGKIVKIDSDGDLHIRVDGSLWCFNPQCCTQIAEEELAKYTCDESNTTEDSSNNDVDKRLKSLVHDATVDFTQTLFKHALGLGVRKAESQESKPAGDNSEISETSFKIGDTVKISDDLAIVKKLQSGHGGWNKSMKSTLGKACKIVKIDSDGDLRISVDGSTWCFNPQCCTHIAEEEQAKYTCDEITTTEDSSDDDVDEALKSLVHGALGKPSGDNSEVAITSRGTTFLHVMCGLGHVDTLKALLRLEISDIDVKDSDGDSCLHHSVFGRQPTITRILLEHGANVNAVNNKDQSALHTAVIKKDTACAKVLLANGCDVNIQDSSGDTALHDAISIGNSELILLLCEHDKTVYAVKNKKGFNTLHQAAQTGNLCATEQILARSSDLVDEMTEDGSTALHLAACKDHSDVAKILITKGKANLEKRNNRNETALMLAVMKGSLALVQLLVEAGADMHAADSEQHTCLQLADLACIDNKYSSQAECQLTATNSSKRTQIARYLAENDADAKRKDGDGTDGLDPSAEDPALHKCSEMSAAPHSEICAATVPKHVAEESKSLEKKAKDYNEALECFICRENAVSFRFRCCHTACGKCAIELVPRMGRCHMCRAEVNELFYMKLDAIPHS